MGRGMFLAQHATFEFAFPIVARENEAGVRASCNRFQEHVGYLGSSM